MKNKVYYARPGQLLEDHLSSVASLAAEFSMPFNSASWGRLAGLWHDLGKYKDAFQDRLTDEAIRVEHSGIGSAHAITVDPKKGLPLAMVIAGHHAGLANLQIRGESSLRPLLDRMEKNRAALAEIRATIPNHLAHDPIPDLPKFVQSDAQTDPLTIRRKLEMWTRFLFSALVDADRLNSESVANPEIGDLRGRYDNVSALFERLQSHLDKLIAGLRPEQQAARVNQIRAEVLGWCMKAAEMPPGFFTLTVPTGGGKTLSAMAFALKHAEKHGLRRVITVIPYTSIIEQNAAVYREAMGDENVIEHHSALDRSTQDEGIAQRHDLAAENWDAPLIVTTSVQFLESLFSNRPSRCRKLHNVAKSVIVLDEVQTLPPEYLHCILEGLNELVFTYGCTVVLSTATPPALVRRENFSWGIPGARDITPEPAKMARDLKRVEYQWPELGNPPQDWPNLSEDFLKHPCALAIVHRRDDARIFTRLIKERDPDTPTLHLSALMCPAHRKAVLNQVKEYLNAGTPCRLVSTQLIEAGVDVDFPVVFRALAGLDSIVQAAGRCNREGKLDKGKVVLFKAPTPPPQGTPRKALDVMESILKGSEQSLDPGDPAHCLDYFRRLYFASVPDAKGIQPDRQAWNFAEVDRKFKLIEDGFTHPIVAPYGNSGRIVGTMEKDGPDRQTSRALQPYIVQIYESDFQRLEIAGALYEPAPGIFAVNPAFSRLYDGTFGLVIDDEVRPDSSSLVI